jgi:addiction module HigA family antidote
VGSFGPLSFALGHSTSASGPETSPGGAPGLCNAEIVDYHNLVSVTAIHPGEHLAEELKALRMSAAQLARRVNVPTNRITEILDGRRAITGDTALRLDHFFGTSAEFWLNLQSLYDLRVAEKRAGKSIRRLPTLKHLDQAHVGL